MRIGLICIFRLGYLLLGGGGWAMHWDGPCGHLDSPQSPKEWSLMTAPRVESVRTKGTILTGTLRIISLNYNYKFNPNFKFCPTQQNSTRTKFILAEDTQLTHPS